MNAILMALALAAAQTPAAPAEAPRVVTAGASKDDLAKIKCVRQAPTGTRFEKRVCKTLGEWYRQGKAAQADLRQIQDRPMVKLCPPAGCGP